MTTATRVQEIISFIINNYFAWIIKGSIGHIQLIRLEEKKSLLQTEQGAS